MCRRVSSAATRRNDALPACSSRMVGTRSAARRAAFCLCTAPEVILSAVVILYPEVYREAIGTVGMAGLVGRGRTGINRGAGSHGDSGGQKGSGGQTLRMTGPVGIAGTPG